MSQLLDIKTLAALAPNQVREFIRQGKLKRSTVKQ